MKEYVGIAQALLVIFMITNKSISSTCIYFLGT